MQVRLLRMRTFGVGALALLLAASAYGFAAANTVPATNAGDGTAAISGYTITAVHYTLNGTTPSNIDSVGFTIAPSIPAGGAVYAKLRSASATYFSCTITGGVTISCNTPGETASAVNELRVVAAQ